MIRKAFRRVVRAVGLDRDQVVRHTAIAYHVQAGVDLPTVKRISGHKTLAMVERYAHANGAHIEAAMDKLQDRLNIGHNPAESVIEVAPDYTEITQRNKSKRAASL